MLTRAAGLIPATKTLLSCSVFKTGPIVVEVIIIGGLCWLEMAKILEKKA